MTNDFCKRKRLPSHFRNQFQNSHFPRLTKTKPPSIIRLRFLKKEMIQICKRTRLFPVIQLASREAGSKYDYFWITKQHAERFKNKKTHTHQFHSSPDRCLQQSKIWDDIREEKKINLTFPKDMTKLFCYRSDIHSRKKQRETSSETFGTSLITGTSALLHHPLFSYICHGKRQISPGAPTLKKGKNKTKDPKLEATFFASTARGF